MTTHYRSKVEYIVNPTTNRNIRVGGKSWLRLVRNGVLERGDYLPPNCAFKLKQSQYQDETERISKLRAEKKRIIDSGEAPDGLQPSFSKNDTIVFRRPKITTQQAMELTSEAALDVIDGIQNGDIEMPQMSRDDARDYLQRLIFDQMLATGKKFKNVRLEPKKKKIQIHERDNSPLKSERGDNTDSGLPPRRKPKKKVKPKLKPKKKSAYYLQDTETETETDLPDSDSEYEYEYVYEDVEVETEPEEEVDYKALLEEQQRKELEDKAE